MIFQVGDTWYRADAVVSIRRGEHEVPAGWPAIEPKHYVSVRLVSGDVNRHHDADLGKALRDWQEALGAARPPSQGAYR